MSGLIFHLIPHTHWDREWYLPRAAFQARLVPALDDLLERLQADPSYRSFLLDGQTVLVADYLSARPEQEAEIRTLVKSGRLQIGPWYVLADELIPSGEALVRNLLLGAADAEGLGGRRAEQDRKRTRLNSSHRTISYAVFCLKKKKIEGEDDQEMGQMVAQR